MLSCELNKWPNIVSTLYFNVGSGVYYCHLLGTECYTVTPPLYLS